MELMAKIVLGTLTFIAVPVETSLALDSVNYVLTDKAIIQLHSDLNACEADAEQIGISDYGTCSEIQHMLISHYSNYAEYRKAREANFKVE